MLGLGLGLQKIVKSLASTLRSLTLLQYNTGIDKLFLLAQIGSPYFNVAGFEQTEMKKIARSVQNRELIIVVIDSTFQKQNPQGIHCPVRSALKICSKSKLKEINRIKEILLDNGYPEDFVLKHISKKITQFSCPKRFGPLPPLKYAPGGVRLIKNKHSVMGKLSYQ